MKRIMSSIMAMVLLVFSTLQVSAAPVSNSQMSVLSSDQEHEQTQKNQISSEISALNRCYINTSMIEKVRVTASGNEYILSYDNGKIETVHVVKINREEVTIVADDGEKSNVITTLENGDVIIDGFKIQISAPEPNPENRYSYDLQRGTVWKGVKSLSPYGSLTASDYNRFLSSGKQNIALGKSMDAMTATALSAVIGSLHTYTGIAVTLAGVAQAVLNVLVAANPKSQYLGCAYTTYTAGSDDYKYINKFYANQECTGTYRQEISYEHFTVY